MFQIPPSVSKKANSYLYNIKKFANQKNKMSQYLDLQVENMRRERAGIPRGYIDPTLKKEAINQYVNTGTMIGSVAPVSRGFGYVKNLGNVGLKKYLPKSDFQELDVARDLLNKSKYNSHAFNRAMQTVDNIADITMPRDQIRKISSQTINNNPEVYWRRIADWLAKNNVQVDDPIRNLLGSIR